MPSYFQFPATTYPQRQLNRILLKFQRNLSRSLRRHVSFSNSCQAGDLGISNEQQIRTYIALAFASIPAFDIIQEASTKRNTGKIRRGRRIIRNGRVDLLARKYVNGINMVIACELKNNWIRMNSADTFSFRKKAFEQHSRAIKQVRRISAAKKVLSLDEKTKVYRLAITAMPLFYRPAKQEKTIKFERRTERSLLASLGDWIGLGEENQAAVIKFKRNCFKWGRVREIYPGILLLCTRA